MMPSVAAYYTNDTNPGAAPQIFIGHSNLSGSNAEPAYDGRMRVVAERGDGRVLLHNPLTGHYWDRRPRHGSWGVSAQSDAEAVRIFEARRW